MEKIEDGTHGSTQVNPEVMLKQLVDIFRECKHLFGVLSVDQINYQLHVANNSCLWDIYPPTKVIERGCDVYPYEKSTIINGIRIYAVY